MKASGRLNYFKEVWVIYLIVCFLLVECHYCTIFFHVVGIGTQGLGEVDWVKDRPLRDEACLVWVD